MKVVYISSEISPVAKVGGLADVSLGLSRAIQKLGHEVCVILPRYAALKEQYFDEIQKLSSTFSITYSKKVYQVEVWKARLHGIDLYLLDASLPKSFFQTSKIYGEKNDMARFSFFSMAALDFVAKAHSDVDLIHINEWHTSLVAPLYKEKYASKLNAKIMLTIHNMNYQGITGPTLLDKVGLSREKYLPFGRQSPSSTKINLMKLGISFSDYINTVSPKYYEEIKLPQNGKGLHDLVVKHDDRFTGILNGIDDEIWNPSTDQALKYNYSLDQLDNKYASKEDLRQKLGIPQLKNTPLVTCICRLVPQKGIHMIKKAIDHTLKSKGQFILFGSSPIPKIQEDFENLQKEHLSNPNAQFIFDSYNEELSHQIYAGADMLICPSIFEPCGLTQLIALQYGTVPIVRQTGGLADTIFDIEHHEERNQIGNGFSYLPPTQKAIQQTLQRAFKVYHNNPTLWQDTIARGMSMDYSWDQSAKKYLQIYEKLIG